jgi:hypothetical protein
MPKAAESIGSFPPSAGSPPPGSATRQSPDPPHRPMFQAPELSSRVTAQDRPREAGRPGRRPSFRRRGCRVALAAEAPRPQGPTKRRRRDVRSTRPRPLPKAWAPMAECRAWLGAVKGAAGRPSPPMAPAVRFLPANAEPSKSRLDRRQFPD